MSTLYRHYRPQLFEEVSGQPQVTNTLQQAILKDRIAHAYLFYGPRGTGKTTTARLLAKRINCSKAKKDSAEPCLKCPSCVAAQAGNNLDIIEIDAASNRGIDDIRSLREAATSRPSVGKYKVYIIDEVHMLTNEAFAALLKTLEEPQSHIVFILATTELHKVPATIGSRCQLYRFRRATHAELQERLNFLLKQEKRKADSDALDFIISRSDGCYRDAESLLGQILTAHEEKITRSQIVELLGLPTPELIDQFLTALMNNESTPALEALESSFAQGFDPEQFVRESIITARNNAVALIKEHKPSEKLPVIIRALLQALQDLAYVPQPLIALHLAVLTLCSKKGENIPAASVTQPAPVQATNKPAIATTTTSPHLEALRTAWPQIIQKLREKNPVASTFLRAIEPKMLDANVLTLRAQYVLHRNYFEKPENKKTLQDTVSEIMQTPLTIRCILEETTPNASAWSSPTTVAASPNFDLYQAAQEVFQVDKN